MREIKFRGKIVENGKWVYGCYFYGYQNYSYMETKEKKHYIEWYDEQNHYHVDEVIPSTVGQYTGLKDKNGKEIWEGDRVVHTSFPRDGQQVRYENGCFVVGQMALNSYHSSVIEVIGNIHDDRHHI